MRTRETKTVARPPAHTSVPIMACPILAAQRQDETPNTGLGQFLSFITHRMRLPNMPTPPAAAAPVIHGYCRTPTRQRGGEGAPRPSRGRGATRHTPTSAAPHPASGWPLARPHSPGLCPGRHSPGRHSPGHSPGRHSPDKTNKTQRRRGRPPRARISACAGGARAAKRARAAAGGARASLPWHLTHNS